MTTDRVTLWKYHGARNDFFLVDASPDAHFARLDDLRAFARALCDRTAGLGADGLVLLRATPPSGDASDTREGRATRHVLAALIVNSDGSLAGTCGNALRCVGLHAARHHGWDGGAPLVVERWTGSLLSAGQGLAPDEADVGRPGVFARVLALRADGTAARATEAEVDVAMGRVRRAEPVALPAGALAALAAPALLGTLAGPALRAAFVELSNPHLVLAAPGLAALDADAVRRVGEYAQRTLPGLLTGVPLSNVGLLDLANAPDAVLPLTVYERGAGLTQCCGSGATAARAALELLAPEWSTRPWSAFAMPGGTVSIGADAATGERVLRGPAAFVGDARFAASSVSRIPE